MEWRQVLEWQVRTHTALRVGRVALCEAESGADGDEADGEEELHVGLGLCGGVCVRILNWCFVDLENRDCFMDR